MLAADFYRRDRYHTTDPKFGWSTNIVLGIIYGNYFKGERTVIWRFNYYNGVNPHGQFRIDDISYIGLDYGIKF